MGYRGIDAGLAKARVAADGCIAGQTIGKSHEGGVGMGQAARSAGRGSLPGDTCRTSPPSTKDK